MIYIFSKNRVQTTYYLLLAIDYLLSTTYYRLLTIDYLLFNRLWPQNSCYCKRSIVKYISPEFTNCFESIYEGYVFFDEKESKYVHPHITFNLLEKLPLS